MWPFTGKRIFGSRWWAIGFVVFVCWQVIEFADPGDDDQASINVQDTAKLADTFNSI
jgi:hypothetical protein